MIFQWTKFGIIFKLLGDPTGALPLDPAGGLLAPRLWYLKTAILGP